MNTAEKETLARLAFTLARVATEANAIAVRYREVARNASDESEESNAGIVNSEISEAVDSLNSARATFECWISGDFIGH